MMTNWNSKTALSLLPKQSSKKGTTHSLAAKSGTISNTNSSVSASFPKIEGSKWERILTVKFWTRKNTVSFPKKEGK